MEKTNRGVVYLGPGKVEVRSIPYPTFEHPWDKSKRCEHGAIIKCIATNICGSDQHSNVSKFGALGGSIFLSRVRGRTTAPSGLVLGHEITGEVVEVGRDVEVVKLGDIVSVPFNIACGRCTMCKQGKTGVCLNVNPSRPGGAYGYVDMGGWIGGQAEYVMVPYADFNLLVFPNKEKAMAKMTDLALLSDIFPTGFHGAVTAGVTAGSTVYVAGAGPVGLACAASCFLLGAACVIVGDLNQERLEQAKSFGCHVVDLTRKDATLLDQIEAIVGERVVDCAVDCVGFEARGCGHSHGKEVPAQVLNDVMQVTRVGGAVGIPGLYVTEDPGAVDESAKVGSLSLRLGLGWAKSLSFATGQCPVMKYHRQLMNAILFDRVQIAKCVNATVISLDDAAQAYQDFDKGVAKKFILDPHGLLRAQQS